MSSRSNLVTSRGGSQGNMTTSRGIRLVVMNKQLGRGGGGMRNDSIRFDPTAVELCLAEVQPDNIRRSLGKK